jgi:4-hydroxybenzoate polyprenyltransferase
MPARVSEKKLFISILLFIAALLCAGMAFFIPALQGSGWALALLIGGFIIGRTAVMLFNRSIKKIN